MMALQYLAARDFQPTRSFFIAFGHDEEVSHKVKIFFIHYTLFVYLSLYIQVPSISCSVVHSFILKVEIYVILAFETSSSSIPVFVGY